MILTDITTTKQGNAALFLDDEFAFSVAPELVHTYGLRIGQTLEPATLAALKEEALENKAKQKALSMLSRQEYTRSQLEKRLEAKVGAPAAQAAAQRMEELGLVDDADYAIRYARTLSRKGYAERRIAAQMRSKGLSQGVIAEAVEELDADPVAQAADFLEKKYPLWREDAAVKRRAYGALARRGFRYEDIRRAMDGLESEYEDAAYGEPGDGEI